jgi:hypothetical protein
MKREGSRLIGELLSDFVRSEGLEPGLLRMRIFQTWDLIVGETYAKATVSKFYRDGILYCTISSSTVRTQMYFQKGYFMEQINKALNAQYITEIVLK